MTNFTFRQRPGIDCISEWLRHGSGIRPLPAHRDRVRGFTADFLILDEAASIPDERRCWHRRMAICGYCRRRRGGGVFFDEDWIAKQSSTRAWLKISNVMRDMQGCYSRYLNKKYWAEP